MAKVLTFKGIRLWDHNLTQSQPGRQRVSQRYRQQGCFVNSSEEYLDYLRQHDEIKKIREAIRSTNDEEEQRRLKQNLPTVMFGCYNTAMDQGWGQDCLDRQTMNVVIDVDHIDITEDVRKRVLQNPLVLYCDVSARGHGLHIVIKRKYKDYVRCQKEFCKEVNLPYDPACKNPNRLLYVASEDDVLIIKDELFDPVSEQDMYKLDQLESLDRLDQKQPLGGTTSDLDWKVQLIDQLFHQIGKPKTGINNNRHSKRRQVIQWYLQAMHYLHVSITIRETIDIFVQHFHFGGDEKTVADCVKWCFKQELKPYLPWAVRNVLGLDSQPELLAEDESEYWAQRIDKINLPWQWRTMLNTLPRHKWMAGLADMLPAWGTMGSGICFIDCDKHIERHTNFNVWLVAEQGTGKQEVFELGEMVIKPLLDREKIFHRERDEFNEMMDLGGGKAEKGKKQPKNPILTGDLSFSTNELTRTLRDARRKVMDYYGIEHEVQDKVYLRTSEGTYALTQLNKGFNDFALWMLLSYGSENKQCTYKERTMVSGPVPAAIEWNILTNRNPFFEFAKRIGLSSGFLSRVILTSFPLYKESPTDMEAQEKLRKELPKIQRDAMRLHNMVVNVGCHWQKLNDKVKQIKAEAGDDRVRANATHRPYNETGPMAGALSAALRSLDTYEKTGKIEVNDDDIAIAELIADFQYQQFMKLFYRLIVAENERGNSLERQYARTAIDVPYNSPKISEQRLANLPPTFTAVEGMSITGMDTKKKFMRWCNDEVKKGNLVKTGEYAWQKV